MNQTTIRWITALQIVGFLVVVGVIWMDEYFDLPHLLFNSPPTPLRIGECVFETAAIILLSFIIIFATLKLHRRLKELESLLRICAWCKKVNVGDQWMPLENYLHSFQKTTISHGMCPSCYEQLKIKQFETPST
jgi:hypothetical protein